MFIRRKKNFILFSKKNPEYLIIRFDKFFKEINFLINVINTILFDI